MISLIPVEILRIYAKVQGKEAYELFIRFCGPVDFRSYMSVLF